MLDLAQQLSWAVAVRHTPDFYQARSQARLMLQGSRATQDPAVTAHLKSVFDQDLLTHGLNQSHTISQFVEQAHIWLQHHRSNRVQGLNQFRRDYSAGTTQSFDSFYWRHRQRRMRCLVGEYFYHLKAWISTDTNWSFVTDSDPLVPGDALVISVPFCDTGNQPHNFDEILHTCNRLEIPVLVDCCYYTISSGIDINVAQPCVDTVCFSLSKSFPVANLRIGIRYTRPDVYDGQRLMNSINYNNSLSAYIGCEIIDRFGSDYIYQTYHDRQQTVCRVLGLEPSQSVIFALGDSQWNLYNRNNLLETYQLDLSADLFCNRICLVSIYDNWDIFTAVTHET